jgi:uncharacterized tellurite resistance protein B-like protein
MPAMIFGGRKSKPDAAPSGTDLEKLVRAQLPDADEDTHVLVTAITGLLACVAFADRDYSEAEQAHVREVVERIHGLPAQSTSASDLGSVTRTPSMY